MLTFDAAAHKYYWNGEDIPGVTSILKAQGFMPPYPETAEAFAKRDAGSAIHNLTAAYDWGLCSAEELRAQGNQGSEYLRFLAEFGHKEWHVIEGAVACPKLWYAGTMDRGGIFAGRPCIVDLKCTDGSTPKYAAIQAIAYGYAWLGMDVLRSCGYALRLRSEGDFKITRHWETPSEAEPLLMQWLSCLNNYHWLKGTWKKKGVVPPTMLTLALAA